MSTKIQINSLEALERLIGNDNELEIEVRNNIVQDFTKKHLKAVADSEVHKRSVLDLQELIRKECEKEIEENVGKGQRQGSYHSYFELKPQAKTQIADTASAAVYDLINISIKAATEKIMKTYTPEYIESLIASKIERLTDKLVEQKLEQRLNDLRKLLK